MRMLLLILLLPALANAELVLSEIMSNEPGDTIEYEWIELYNNSDSSLFIDEYIVVAGADSFTAGPFRIDRQSYAVLVRRLVAEEAQPSFERRWGNGSGYWGDDPAESYIAIDVEFSLTNGSGSVTLVQIGGSFSDSYQWSSASADGVSMERDQVSPPSANWHPCTDPSGSTPGRANSMAGPSFPDAVTIVLQPKTIRTRSGIPMEISIAAPAGSHAVVEVLDDTARRVRTICNRAIEVEVRIYWDGTGNGGNALPPGIYYMSFVISGQSAVSKTIPVAIAP